MTVFMGYWATKTEMSYDFAKAVPDDDPEMVYFNNFKKTFGLDDNTIILGFADKKVTKLKDFQRFFQFTQNLKKIKGVQSVNSIANLLFLRRDTSNQLVSDTLFKAMPTSQIELDSLLDFAKQMKFYDGSLFNEKGAWNLIVNFEENYIRTVKRVQVKIDIDNTCEEFTTNTNIYVHKAGVPYLRAYVQAQVKAELNLFLFLSILVTTIMLFAFFRSKTPVIVPLLLIAIIIIWTFGTLGLLGYKLTALTGLLPSILVVIAVPNCIYLTTKYHQKCIDLGDKRAAIIYMLSKIGMVTFLTNATTAVGFLVLISTRIDILSEFGIVAGINILATFIISLIFLPTVFYYLPLPKESQTNHLNSPFFQNLIEKIWILVSQNAKIVYFSTLVIVIVSLFGLYKIQSVAFMADDLPETSSIKKDIKFFEENFGGVMPFEIVLDLGKNYAIRDLKLLKKIDSLQNRLNQEPEFAKPMSIVEMIKMANFAFGNFYEGAYEVPNQRGFTYLAPYLSGRKGNVNKESFRALLDSNQRMVRISLRVADVGSIRLDTLVQKSKLFVKEIFAEDSLVKVNVTGTTLLFVKGNDYLIKNLKTSLILACAVIALLMGLLFKRIRIVLIALLPNILPMLFTAGIMGYFGIALKPSTALIFSIAFGISVDDTIHFLAKYKMDLVLTNFDVRKAVQLSLKETGLSMIYTSLVLFGGFVIFVGSEFGGTISLGALTSTTLLVAMFSNLILLPTLLLSFDKQKIK